VNLYYNMQSLKFFDSENHFITVIHLCIVIASIQIVGVRFSCGQWGYLELRAQYTDHGSGSMANTKSFG
jgi:hypothetical protein